MARNTSAPMPVMIPTTAVIAQSEARPNEGDCLLGVGNEYSRAATNSISSRGTRSLVYAWQIKRNSIPYAKNRVSPQGLVARSAEIMRAVKASQLADDFRRLAKRLSECQTVLLFWL